MKKILVFLLIFIQLSASSAHLKKSDIRNHLEEMFTYHVEYKELTPLLVKRSFKSYIEQFDSQKIYMLQSEVKKFFELTSTDIERILDNYSTDQFVDYERLNTQVMGAIQRARNYRQELKSELTASAVIPAPSTDNYSYAESSEQIKNKIRDQMIRFLQSEKKTDDPSYWTVNRRDKILTLFEKRVRRFEESYMGLDGKGEHYFTIHVLKAMAKSLDAHTAFFTPDEAFEMRASLEKQFEGVGVVLKEGVDGVEITGLIKGGPAARSEKIKPGDFLVEIDGHQVTNASYEEVLSRLKSGDKKEVSLGLKRFLPDGKEDVIRVDLKREKILMQEERVQWTAEPFGGGIIGKLVLPSFYESSSATSCETDIREALKELKKQGELLGLVLDLRENLGGFLTQAVKVSGLFITSGVVVISKYAKSEIQYMRSLDPRVYYNGPLVILTSKLSASAAEILAQAVQDYGVAVVVGDERTYGKGTIQYQTVTDGSAASFFKVTVGRYYTVSGRSTQIEGVKADIVVPTEFAPYNIGERYLEYPLHNDQVPSAYIDPMTDVDQHGKVWLQKNYLPYLQKKESLWSKMIPQLKINNEQRLQQDPNYKAFLNSNGSKKSYGVDDLPMEKAVEIVKDMHIMKAS
jgi:carboxyl-terminal processing protease